MCSWSNGWASLWRSRTACAIPPPWARVEWPLITTLGWTREDCLSWFSAVYRIGGWRSRHAPSVLSSPPSPGFGSALRIPRSGRGPLPIVVLRGLPHRRLAKSACTFCPFQSPQSWVRLRTAHPEEWERAVLTLWRWPAGWRRAPSSRPIRLRNTCSVCTAGVFPWIRLLRPTPGSWG